MTKVWDSPPSPTMDRARDAMASLFQTIVRERHGTYRAVFFLVAVVMTAFFFLYFCAWARKKEEESTECQEVPSPEDLQDLQDAEPPTAGTPPTEMSEAVSTATPSSPQQGAAHGGGMECCLMIPILADGPGPMKVSDRHGNTILEAVPRSDPPSPNLGFCLPWYEVLSKSGDTLAHCAAAPQGERPEFKFYRPQFELFGKLVAVSAGAQRKGFRPSNAEPVQEVEDAEDPDRYILHAVAGQDYLVVGSMKERRMRFTDPSGTTIALTEPASSEAYLLRASSLKDVGFILCTLLSLEYLDVSPTHSDETTIQQSGGIAAAS